MPERKLPHSLPIKKEEDFEYPIPPASNVHTSMEIKEEVKTEHGKDPRFFKDNLGPSIRRQTTAKGDRFCRHAFRTDDPKDYDSLKYWPETNDNQPYHYIHSDGSIFFLNPDQSTYYYSPKTAKSRFISPEGHQEFEHYVANAEEAKLERALYCFPCHSLDTKN